MRKLFGKQQDWAKIRANTEQPIITIITSTFKVKDSLHWTYESIKKQTYPYIQWIVVDGASTDGTIELLHQYSDMIDIWFSEPDTGIYDAWNKSLDYIQGDWVQFLGAGDELFESDTIEKVAKHLQGIYPEYKLAYGQVKHVSEYDRVELFVTGKPWENYKNVWEMYRPNLPVHSGIYQHVSLFSLVGKFDNQYKIIADNIFLLKSLEYSQFKFLPFLVDIMPMGGLTGRIDSYKFIVKETKQAMFNLGIKASLSHRVKNNIRFFIMDILLFIFGENGLAKVVDYYRVINGKPKVWTKRNY